MPSATPGGVPVEGALRHVVADEIAGDRLARVLLRQVARALADDDAELDLVVELGRGARRDGVVVQVTVQFGPLT